MLNVVLYVLLDGANRKYPSSRHLATSKLVVGLAFLGWLVVVLNGCIQTYLARMRTHKLFRVQGTENCDWDRYDLCGITHKERLYRGEVWAGLLSSMALMLGSCYGIAGTSQDCASAKPDVCLNNFEGFTDVWVPVAIGFQATALVPLLSIIDRLSLLTEEAHRLLNLDPRRLQELLRESRVLSTDQVYVGN